MRPKTVMLAFGTRPEAIKMAPVYREFRARSGRIRTICCITGQHRELLDPFLEFFDIRADYDLNIIKDNQGLFHITTSVLKEMEHVLMTESPDIVLVQGDTSSAFAAALAAFYLRIPVGHVEAGLRSYDKFQPFPEEINRTFISHMADLNFCPTPRASQNLLKEQISSSSVFVTGNTVVDALVQTLGMLEARPLLPIPGLDAQKHPYRMILVTGHRRENFGEGLRNLSLSLVELADKFPDVIVVYSVHPNPNVRVPVEEILRGHPRISLIPPPDYFSFVGLMKDAFLIITDSGGIQEEAPSLGKPLLVARNLTERPEAVECGAARLVGTDPRRIVEEASLLLNDPAHYRSMTVEENPFGDGRAAERIADLVEEFLGRNMMGKV